MTILLSIASFSTYSYAVQTGSVTQVEAVGVLDGEEHVYTIQYDDNWQLANFSGDTLTGYHPDEDMTDVRELFRALEAYYIERGGTFEFR